MDFNGTDGDDSIDAERLGIRAGDAIYGKRGNDRITFGQQNVIGGAGNDTLIGTHAMSTAAYWDSPRGVRVDLGNGTAEDGFGGTDTLINIRWVQGSGWNDTLIGSNGDDNFYTGGGSNTVIGGGGRDTVSYYFEKSTAATITYNAGTATFTIVKNFVNGDRGTDTLTNVAAVSFSGPGSDQTTLVPANFTPVGGFLRGRDSSAFTLTANQGVSSVRSGDFNGDGHIDIYLATQFGLGESPAPVMVLLGNGSGRFVDGTAQVFAQPPRIVVGGGRGAVADFNLDGISDILQLDFGLDAPPYPGGVNRLFVSNNSSVRLEDKSSQLLQTRAQNHALSTGDVNGDGYPDAVVNTLEFTGNGNVLYLNNGNGTLVPRLDLTPHPRGASGGVLSNTSSGLVDVSGDGRPDLIVGRWDGGSSSPATWLLVNDGTGNFTRQSPIALPSSPVPLEVVLDVKGMDLNADGLQDLVLSITEGGGSSTSAGPNYYNTGYIQVLMNKGRNTFADETAQRMPAEILNNKGRGWFITLYPVDLDRDGFEDLVASGAGGGASSVVLMNRGNGTFVQSWVSEPMGITVPADVDEDGMVDLMTITSQGSVTVDLNKLVCQGVFKAAVGGGRLVASAGNDKVTGSAVADVLVAAGGDDVLSGAAGNDRLEGGAGRDVAVYGGALKDYTVAATGPVGSSSLTVTDLVAQRDGQDTLIGVERLQFADKTLNLTVQATAAAVPRSAADRISELYVAFFNRIPDADGLEYWLQQHQAGRSVVSIANDFYAAGVQFSSLTGFSGSMTNADFVNLVYRNVLGRADGADSGGLAYWTGELSSGRATRGTLVSTMLDSAHTFKGDAKWGWVANLLDNKIAVARQVAVDWGLNYLTPDASVSNGMAIAKAVTPTDTSAAIALVGIPTGAISLG